MRIAFLCTAHTGNVWTAESVKTGIGGSEEAVIHMAELLGRRGHDVSVNIPGAQGRMFGSVRYDDYNSLCGAVIDVAVMWRFPEFAANLAESPENFGLPVGFTLQARRSYLWLHDWMQVERVGENAHFYDKVMVLSNTHRQLYPQLPDDRILVSSNGIDVEQFDSDESDRDPHLIVYGSDYERGLATLLSAWPAIKKAVPECRLNVFYGWQTVEALFPERAKALHRQLDPLLCQPGVTHLGRINHQAVAQQYMRAGVWAYPCRYLEISCISAMKAQAGGAIPVVIPMGALQEVVQFGFRTHCGYDDIDPAAAGELETEWANGLIGLLSSPAEQTRIREVMVPASKARFSWSAVAAQWEREFTETPPRARARHDLAASGPVPARPAICLNAIVKNEAHIIAEMLDSVAPYISSWVIVDTGSDDGTQELIRNHMARLGIPGELHERPWRDFGHNRTEALNLAQGHGDYIWVMDADDTVVGTPDLTRLDADMYLMRVVNDDGGSFWRAQLFRDGLTVRYQGVVHEFAVSDDPCVTRRLEGDYHLGDHQRGARSRDGQKQKYARDRDLLLAEVERNPEDAKSVFYLAQSYFDMDDFANARKWFARRVEMGGDEAVYVAMYRLADSMASLDERWPDVVDAYLRAWEFRPTRAEPLFQLAFRHRLNKRYRLGHLFAKLAAEIPLPEEDTSLVCADVYAWRAVDEQAVCASWIDKHAEAFTLWRRLLAQPDIPDADRQRIAGNRDVCVPAMTEAASSYPDALVRSLVTGPGEAEVVVSLIAGPDRAGTERALNSFLNCCTDVSRVGRFLVLDAGLSAQDRATLSERYGFLEFCPPGPDDGPGAQLSHIRDQIRERFWLHLGQSWRFFAAENLIARLISVLDAEAQVFQVGINFTDAVRLTGACAAEQTIRRTPDAGRYLLTKEVACGPAMFDCARLDRAGGLHGTDADPITALQRRAGAVGLGTASLDEVLCIADRPDELLTGVFATRRRRCPAGFEKVFNISLHRSGTRSVHELLLRSGIPSIHWPITFKDVNYEDSIAGHEDDRSYVAAALAPVIDAVTAVHDVPIPAVYDLLDAAYPNSAFILMFRSPFDWVRSVRNHVGNRDLDPFERVQYWRYFPSRPTSLRDLDDAALYSAYLTHHRDVLAYFENRGNCLFLDLQQPDVGQKICSFLGLPPIELRHIDVSIRIA